MSAQILVILAIVAIGVTQFVKIPIALYPDTSQSVLLASLSPQGYTPEDFKSRYGKNIEAKLLALDGVTQVEGTYNYRQAKWKVTFDWGFKEKEAKKLLIGSTVTVLFT